MEGPRRRSRVVRRGGGGVELVSGEYAARALSEATMDWFWEAMGPANLAARGAADAEGYRRSYALAVVDPADAGPEAAHDLESAAAEALGAVRGAVSEGRAPAEMMGLFEAPVWPWRVALLGGPAVIEGGMPHTVHDMISLPAGLVRERRGRRLAALLVHEATHVFQRMRPARARSVLLGEFGLLPAGEAASALGWPAGSRGPFPMFARYAFDGPGASAFAPLRPGDLPAALLGAWRAASAAGAAGGSTPAGAAAFHEANWQAGLTPRERGLAGIGGPEPRANPDADALAWVRVVAPGAGRAWPGGLLFAGRQRFVGPGFSSVEMSGGDADALGPGEEHPHERMAASWERASGLGRPAEGPGGGPADPSAAG